MNSNQLLFIKKRLSINGSFTVSYPKKLTGIQVDKYTSLYAEKTKFANS